MDDDNFSKVISLIIGLALIAVAVAFGYIVEDDTAACRSVATLGMHDCRLVRVHQIAPSLYGCGHDDLVGYEVTATTASGQSASGTVCCGWFKSCTLRTQ